MTGGSGRAGAIEWRPWLLVAVFSLISFLTTASTYASLGVVLPRMVAEEGWNWTEAGLGFTLLGAMTGASSFVPAFLIRRLGVRPTLALGCAVMTAGFVCLGATNGVWLYFLAASLCGIGFQMLAVIPATHVIAAAFKRRGLPFGIYFTMTSAGGVAGPIMTLTILGLLQDRWRLFWLCQGAATLVVGGICIALIGSPAWLARRAMEIDRDVAEEAAAPKRSGVYRTTADWTVRRAVRTPQFYVLLAAYFGHLLIGIAVSSVSVAHLTERGVAAGVAAAMLSLESLVGAASRALGGALGDIVDPRYLLIIALGAMAVGAGALSVAHTYPMMLLYALGSGTGFGLTALAVPLLVLNYFGRRHNLEIFALTCQVGALSAFGSVAAGAIRDSSGGFTGAFQLYALVIAAILAAALFMRPPRPDASGAAR
jgi:MFS family permease